MAPRRKTADRDHYDVDGRRQKREQRDRQRAAALELPRVTPEARRNGEQKPSVGKLDAY